MAKYRFWVEVHGKGEEIIDADEHGIEEGDSIDDHLETWVENKVSYGWERVDDDE